MRRKKIQDNKPFVQPTNIREPHTPSNQDTLHFSFKYLDFGHKKFCIKNSNAQYFLKMLERFKGMCTKSALEIQSDRSSSLKAHPIEWSGTTEKKGFQNLNLQLKQLQPYQFQISTNKHGRVHGFFLGNIFFIVWFDPDHKLYS